MEDEGGKIEYTVVVDGDMYAHEAFREMVHEYGGEIVNEEDAE